MKRLWERLRDGPPLAAPRWLQAGAYAALAAAPICLLSWPGFMSFDSLLAYEQAFTGVQTAGWPPMHTYLFWISKSLGAGAWGVFVAQTVLLFLGAGVVLNMLAPGRRLALLGQAGFALGFVYFPVLLGAAMVQWRDVTTASFGLLALALWLAAARARSIPLLVGAAAAIGCAAALRYNALALFALVIPLMVAAPFLTLRAPLAARLAGAASLVLFIGLAGASTVWRLPDLQRLPKPSNFATAQLHDLFGVSVCTGRDLLPAAVTQGAPITVEQIRRAYDPRHLNITMAPKPGVPRLYEQDTYRATPRRWRETIPDEPGCYLWHRTQIALVQLGLPPAGVFYPTHGTIDPNRFGLEVARPGLAAAAVAYVERNAGEAWRRPFLLYLAAAVIGLAAAFRRPEAAPLLLALLGGAFAYLAPLYVAAPAGDARYIFPSNVLCLLLILAGAGLLLRRPGEVRP